MAQPSRNIYAYETHNRPPSEYEARHLSRRISEALAELRTINDDIVRATHALEALRHRKALRLKDLVALRKAMAPVRRLPAEILGEIFSWAVTSQNNSDPIYDNAYTSPVEVNNALSFLWQICDRVEVLKLISPPGYWQILNNFPEGSFVALSELHFSEVYQFNDSPPSFADVIDASEVAPNLRCLSLESHSIPTSLDPLINTIHWNQLTTLTLITPIEFYVAQWILSQCIEMQDFTVDFADAAGATIHLAPQMLPHLHRMCCDAFFRDEGSSLSDLDFFRPFSLPSLNIIDLRHLWPGTHIASLHQRSPFRVTRLSLHEVEISTVELIEFLQQHPMISDLCLSQMCQCTTDKLYSAITFDPNSTADPLIPLLRKLTTVGSFHEDGNGSTYAAMIESRWWAYDWNCALRTGRISRLESVSIDVAFIDTSQMKERLSDLVSAGVVKFG
ncbi:hypothetical protein C8J57DRAFT_1720701 [Mycena rebaudengoi]|nr:hypothetical protein C8J57DRAFT_1720701 [Mycena rebaudengoi]